MLSTPKTKKFDETRFCEKTGLVIERASGDIIVRIPLVEVG
jgi:hypothetical protein